MNFHFPNITLPFTNFNPQGTFMAPFGGQRLYTASKNPLPNTKQDQLQMKLD